MQELVTFISNHWAAVSGIGAVGFAIATAVFNIIDRYRKIPAMDTRLKKLENGKDEVCLFHDECLGDLKTDIEKLDEKICKNITGVQNRLTIMDTKRDEAKDKLHDELVSIHQTLGLIQGSLKT